MPTIRDLVGVLRQREGVEAAVVLGRDGLLIDSDVQSTIDAENMAALIPQVVAAGDDLGAHDGRGAVQTAILEFAHGIAVICVLNPDAILLVIAQPTANLGQLLFELRRNRANIASLV